MINIGQFKVTSGKLVVTDPCYERGTWCQGVLKDVREGTWNAYVTKEDDGMFGPRVAQLVVLHEDESVPTDPKLFGTAESFSVGVDSGQAGFFDDDIYPRGDREQGGDYNKDAFYDECCYTTVGEGSRRPKAKGTLAGIVQNQGCVSSSGYGDGGYRCYTKKDERGRVVGARIEFIGDEEEDADEEITEEVA